MSVDKISLLVSDHICCEDTVMEAHSQANACSRGSSSSRIGRDLSNGPGSSSLDRNLLQEPGMLQRVFSSRRVPHVCVIGAGMAGLRCAEVLTTNGFKVTILEGRDRIGGRIHQSKHLGHLIDMGPNWIHGTDSNPILEIARATKSILHSWGERQNVIDQHGKPFAAEKAEEYSEFMWSTIVDAFQYSNEKSDSIPPQESLLDFFKKRIKERAANEVESQTNSGLDGVLSSNDKRQLQWMAEMWGPFIGDPIARQSLKFFWLEECLDGENLFLASTYKAVLDYVATRALENAALQLSKKVTSIEGLDTQSTVSIATSDGIAQDFDEVVVTAPLGWLKNNKEAFTPPLESRLSIAIDAISYGHLEKVYMTFPRAFWEDGNSSTGHTQGWEQGAAANSDGGADFWHWMHPTYASETNPQSWNQEAVNLAALSPDTAQPTLLFYIFGPCSSHVTSMLSKLPPSEHHEALIDFFKPYYSLIPNYDANSTDCTPVASAATSWSTDELAGYGSYCNFQVGLTDADGDIEAMRRGMPERRIWLAGEHTAPFVALGTTTGAYWSGEGVAHRIIEAYGRSRCDEETYAKVREKRPDLLGEETKGLNGVGA